MLHSYSHIVFMQMVCVIAILYFNQSIKLESEARVVASGRVLLVIEKVGLEVFFESI